MVIPVCNAARRLTAGDPQRSLDRRDARGPGSEPCCEQREQADYVQQAGSVILEAAERRVDDLLTVLGDIHEDEGQDADREHRQRDAHPLIDTPEPTRREP
jgi:hypothetical protein